jgi:tRNA1Val (adenine37-N6)-methyltransferase
MSSSINQKYTFQYSQPEEYHFSHDSVFLAQFVFDWLKKNPNFKINNLADVCAGCGIIGMDLLFHLNENQCKLPAQTDFIEVQNVYESHFEKNKTELNQKTELNFINANYADLAINEKYKSKYDLILCNPPYFKVGQGKLSPSQFKNRCRFYMDSDFLSLVKFIKHSIAESGMAFVLLRSLKDHGTDWGLDQLSNQFDLNFEIVGDVRGTDVLKIKI